MGGFIGFVVALVAGYLGIVFVTPFTFGIGGIVAVGVAFFEFATAAAWVFRGAAAPIGHLRIEPRTAGSGDRHPPEPAYRSYYLGPVFADYALAVRMAGKAGWERVFGGRPPDPATGAGPKASLSQELVNRWRDIGMYVPLNPPMVKAILFVPLAGALVGLAAGAGAAAAVTLVISVALGFAVAVGVAVAVVLAVLMRVIELAVLRVRSITLECGACHRRVGMPAYLCPHCPPSSRALHHRLVPGRYGVFSRICRCGNVLPTLLVMKKYLLEGYCEHCNAALPRKGMTTPTFHIPVVAGRQAGKTVFMTAAVAGLERSEADGFEFADHAALQEYVRARDALQDSSFDAIHATIAVDSAPAFNVYLGSGLGRRLMYLYDAAGERFEQESGIESLGYLEHTAGVVVVIDPFSFDHVRRSAEAEIVSEVRYSLADVDDVISRFAEGQRRISGSRGGSKLDIRAAIVLTKCDALLRSATVAHPFDQLGAEALDLRARAARSAAVRGWLDVTAGQKGLLSVFDNTFARTEFFAVSARDAFNAVEEHSGRTQLRVRNDDPAMPLHWLLERRNRR